MQEYNLEGYSNEAVNIDEGKGRGMFLFIHKSLPFQVHQFDIDFNEAQFCTLKLKGKSTLLKPNGISLCLNLDKQKNNAFQRREYHKEPESTQCHWM